MSPHSHRRCFCDLCERTLLDIVSRSHTSGEINLLGRTEKYELGRAEHVCMLFPETGKESVRAGYIVYSIQWRKHGAFYFDSLPRIHIHLMSISKYQGLYS